MTLKPVQLAEVIQSIVGGKVYIFKLKAKTIKKLTISNIISIICLTKTVLLILLFSTKVCVFILLNKKNQLFIKML